MEKVISRLFFACLFSLGTLNGQSQVEFGVKGGLNLTFFRTSQEEFGFSPETFTGFYGGGFAGFNVDDDFTIQPEILYIVLNDFNFVNAPVYAKYEVAQKVSLLVGPSINYFFEFFSNKLKVRADIATSYNITPEFDVHMKYTLGFQEVTPNGLFIGLGWKI